MEVDFFELTQNLERAHSTRIALRPVALADAWPLFHATRNPAFNKHLLWPQPDREERVLQRVEMIMDAARKGRLCAVSAVAKRTGEWIALFRFQPHLTRSDVMEMGVWLHDRFWHGRYALELGRLCVSAAFSLSNAQVLLGASAPENRASCHLMTSVGMTAETEVMRDVEGGAPVMLREYTITRAAWQAHHTTAFSVVGPAGTSAAARAGPASAVVNREKLPIE